MYDSNSLAECENLKKYNILFAQDFANRSANVEHLEVLQQAVLGAGRREDLVRSIPAGIQVMTQRQLAETARECFLPQQR